MDVPTESVELLEDASIVSVTMTCCDEEHDSDLFHRASKNVSRLRPRDGKYHCFEHIHCLLAKPGASRGIG